MDREHFIFNPGTNTCQAPLPTKFEHVLKFVTKAESFKTLHSHEDITNVNQILEETLNLQISNIIQRVVAQVIGESTRGFTTIKGTSDGALHVYVTNPEDTTPSGWSKAISSAAGGDVLTIEPTGSNRVNVVNVVLVVGGETDITYYDGDTPISGPMDFGGENEPRGMVTHHGNFPLRTSPGSSFKINSSAAVQVSGYVVYYEEP